MAPVQPKRPAGGAFGAFMAEKRPEFMKACAGKPVSAVSKMGGDAWKQLNDKQKEPYQKKYEANKAQYEKDLAAFLAAGGAVEKGATAKRTEKRKEKEGKKKKKDANAPKKPAGGAYGVYLAENRESIVKSLPAGHKITDVAKKAGELWKALPDATKKPFEAKYEVKKAEYAKALEEYNKTQGGKQAEGDEPAEEESAEKEVPKKKARKAGA